jgi:hypothetical protein
LQADLPRLESHTSLCLLLFTITLGSVPLRSLNFLRVYITSKPILVLLSTLFIGNFT